MRPLPSPSRRRPIRDPRRISLQRVEGRRDKELLGYLSRVADDTLLAFGASACSRGFGLAVNMAVERYEKGARQRAKSYLRAQGRIR